MSQSTAQRIVIAVLGKNRPGIVAGVSGVLGEADVDIRDITQSIIGEIFTMTMIADIGASPLGFTELQSKLSALSGEIGVEISVQREDVFTLMHRL
ncbi:ACT domain-containing protein [Coriobacterium glomerans PW2]|uniref:UPF0237 protein Corgl_0695 n=1 Tax=Coriobacterium glomerans (strain ATCC 49209 / DSM 20642 / JCM 10262 / PW2) TaxID=700015 RepID=F2N7J3_CORGP|nr:ACT domain-containing protein [Coriobacterium glomerans]AEB06809.1 ACT domain-containing protein [Coriobacterium glomerans PW2]